MNSNLRRPPWCSQKGVMLIASVVLLFGGSALFLLYERNGVAQRNHQIIQSLTKAKEALIAYAVNYADNYGHNTRGGVGRLPCPSIEKHGSPARSCSVSEIGFLPTAWLRDGLIQEIDYLERFLDQEIWYSVAGDHRYNPSFNHLTSYSRTDLLSVDAQQDIIAILLAPGKPLTGQQRQAGWHQTAEPYEYITAYLEGDNADLDSSYTFTEAGDLILPVYRKDLMPLMERRVLGLVKHWLIEYKNTHGFYPYASPLGDNGTCAEGMLRGLLSTESGSCEQANIADEYFHNLPTGRTLKQTWFYRYGWGQLVYYLVDESCTPANGPVDCDGINDPQRQLSVNSVPVEVILISVGEPIITTDDNIMQQRSSDTPASYLDTNNLLPPAMEFFVPPLSEFSNDQLVYIN